MRILMFTYEFPPRLGGMQQMAYQLARQFQVQGHEVRVLTVHQTGDTEFDARQEFAVHRHHGEADDDASLLKRLGMKWQAFGLYRQEVRDFHPDTVLSTFWDPSGYIAALMSLTGLHTPYYIIGHGTELHHLASRGPARWAKQALRRLTFQRARGIFAVSHYTGDRIHTDLGMPTQKIKVVPNGIALDEAVAPESGAREVQITAPRLLTVCRLVPRKGCDTVIRTLPHLIPIFPNLQYNIVGDGPECSRLKKIVAELNLDSQVNFLGSLSDADREAHYRQDDIFVMPARQTATDYEGFGIVYLEAMARRLPVIGTTTGGIPDAIADEVTGLLVPPDDPVALAQAIRRLIEDAALRTRLTTTAMQVLRERFLWSTIAQQYVQHMSVPNGAKPQ